MGDAAWLNDPGENELTDKEQFAHMARMGYKPDFFVNAEERAKYIKFLETYKPEDDPNNAPD